MSWLAIGALVCGAAALGRQVAGVAWLARFLRRARLRHLPTAPTPPLSLVVPLHGAPPGLETNLEAILRQNHPDFEVLFAARRPGDPALAVAGRAARAVPDVATRVVVGGEPTAANPVAGLLARARGPARHGQLAAAAPAVRPDPLFLRDVANGLDEAEAVAFLPVRFGMRTWGARLVALLLDTDGLLTTGIAGGRFPPAVAVGVRADALDRAGGVGAIDDRAALGTALAAALRRTGARVVLARRAARVHAPGADARTTAREVVDGARVLASTAPLAYLALGLPALAPALWLAAAATGTGTGPALGALALHTLVRAVVAVAVDLRFCWDGSLRRALPLLPLLWLAEPLAWGAGWTGRGASLHGRRVKLRGGRVRARAGSAPGDAGIGAPGRRESAPSGMDRATLCP